MAIGLLGHKIGSTRIFLDEGKAEHVSVIEVVPNRVSDIKHAEKHKYNAIQLTGGTKKASRLSKPEAGHFARAKVEAGDIIAEFRVDSVEGFDLGQTLSVSDVFQEGQYVDVAGTSKGKGFAGAVKRHNFRTQDATHGNSLSHRAPGSIGQNQTPGRVFKGKKMAGHMGNKRCTVQKLKLVRLDAERNLLLVRGAIPGAPGTKLEITHSVKAPKEIE
ncbi:MAG: 50S ribosomal protein L3 [Legionellaceae bacterium]|nr:50S ribosomal protein L3 [Legionellaceae bacterium]